jgi:hypothetical protein
LQVIEPEKVLAYLRQALAENILAKKVSTPRVLSRDGLKPAGHAGGTA